MVIYIVMNGDYNNRDREKYGVEYFSSIGYTVVVLDVRDYTNPELKDYPRRQYIQDNNVYVHICANFQCIEKNIKEYGQGVAFLFLSDNYQSIKISRFLQKSNIKIGSIYDGMVPTASVNRSLFQKLFEKFKILSVENFISFVCRKLYSKFFNVKYYDFLLTNNVEMVNLHYNLPQPLKVIDIHTFDYELTLKNREVRVNYLSNKYVVFIDQNILEHTDFIRAGIKLNMSSTKYYEELDNYFDLIESIYGYETVVSVHPRADIEKYKKRFKGRKIIQGETCNLVKHCEFVMTHYSTAVNFAIIYKKPILFLTTNELQKTILNQNILSFVSATNQPSINISKLELPENIEIDSMAYQNYMITYIKRDNSQESPFKKFETEYLKQLNERK